LQQNTISNVYQVKQEKISFKVY